MHPQLLGPNSRLLDLYHRWTSNCLNASIFWAWARAALSSYLIFRRSMFLSSLMRSLQKQALVRTIGLIFQPFKRALLDRQQSRRCRFLVFHSPFRRCVASRCQPEDALANLSSSASRTASASLVTRATAICCNSHPWLLLLMLQPQQHLVRHHLFNLSKRFFRAASVMLTVAGTAASLLKKRHSCRERQCM